MGFSKIRMGKEEIFETVVKDYDGRQIDKWVCMKGDYFKVVRTLSDKYGLKFKIIKRDEDKPEESKNDRDLNWAI